MVEIRLAEEADAGAIAAIYGPVVERTVISFETVPPSRAEIAGRILRITATHPWLVCEVWGHVVGYAYATEHRVRAAYRWSVDTSVYVDDQHRRRGVGRGLYTSLFEILRAQRFFNAYAGITLPNAPSVALHEGLGFRQVGVFARVGYKFGAWHDVGWWQLGLTARSDSPEEPVALPALMERDDWKGLARTGEVFVRAATEGSQ